MCVDMHEDSLIRTVLRQVADLMHQHGAVAVEEIELETGPLSNAEPLLLQSAFERLSHENGMRHAQLVIRTVDLEVRCESCGHQTQLTSFDFQCRQCHSRAVRVIRGDQIRLLSVRMQFHDSVGVSNTGPKAESRCAEEESTCRHR